MTLPFKNNNTITRDYYILFISQMSHSTFLVTLIHLRHYRQRRRQQRHHHHQHRQQRVHNQLPYFSLDMIW